MNILFFLTPKIKVAYLYDDCSLRQALEKMEYHRYTAIPIIKKTGEYVGTLTEGDLLWYIKNEYDLDIREAEDIAISEIHRHKDNLPVYVLANIEDLISLSINQNFVPVLDDHRSFIGIITRKDIIQYCYKKIKEPSEEKE